MSKLSYIIQYISRRNPIHTKKLNKTLTDLGEDYNQRAEEFLAKYESLLLGEGKNLDFAVDCYLRMLADLTMEAVSFRKTGEYSSKSFEEANRRVYGDPLVMDYYMHGLLLSQFLWKHHYKMFRFFVSELEKRKNSAKNYLEIGGGHGLHVAEATKVLGPDSHFTVVDISPTSLALARRLVGDSSVRFVLSDIFDYRPDKKFDFITLGEVLEHVEDPRSLLAWVADLLADHGTLFITTPANAPTIDHIYLFRNEDDIRGLIRDANLTIATELSLYAEDVDRETAEKHKITLLYGASLQRHPFDGTCNP